VVALGWQCLWQYHGAVLIGNSTKIMDLSALLPAWLAPPQLLLDAAALLAGEAALQRKWWVATLPRGRHAAALFGEAAAPTYAAVVLLLCVIAVFYLKVTVFARSFQSCGSARLGTRALARSQCVWGVLSSLAGLALFVYEMLGAGGGARLLNGLAGGSVKPFRLPFSWALTFNSLAVDAALTLLASAPLLLRAAGAVVPGLHAAAYPPFPPPPKAQGAGGAAAAEAEAPAPALGSAAEALRALDCCDLVLARLVELALMYALHKYQR
jgi:hypothetical protein